jgi:lipopolysaccharide biosynthesis protein
MNKVDICIILHLYYIDMWDEIVNYLNNINYKFDLYITLTKENDNSNIENIINNSKLKDNVKGIYILENRGMDIGPFLYVFNELINNNLEYKYLVKIHTKKGIHENRPFEKGLQWKNDLFNAILSSPERVDYIINLFNEDENLGIIGTKKWLVDKKHAGYIYNHEHIKYFIEKLNIKTKFEDMIFIGGTMFWCDYKILFDFLKKINLLEIINEFEYGAKTDSHFSRKTHAFERILGYVFLDYNKKIIGI